MFLSAWQLDRRSDACKRSTNGGVTALTVINIGGSLYRLDFIADRSDTGNYVDRATSKERRQRQHRGKPSPFAVGVVAAQPRGPPRRHRCKSLPENMPIIDRNFERFRSRSCTQVTDWPLGSGAPRNMFAPRRPGHIATKRDEHPLRLFQPTRRGHANRVSVELPALRPRLKEKRLVQQPKTLHYMQIVSHSQSKVVRHLE